MKGKCTKMLLALIAALPLAFASGCGGGQEASGSGTASVAAQAQQGETGHKAQGGKTSGKQDSAEAARAVNEKIRDAVLETISAVE